MDIDDLVPKVPTPTLIFHAGTTSRFHSRKGAASPRGYLTRFVALESENYVPMPDESAWSAFIDTIAAFLRG
jgi:hypothetical protein